MAENAFIESALSFDAVGSHPIKSRVPNGVILKHNGGRNQRIAVLGVRDVHRKIDGVMTPITLAMTDRKDGFYGWNPDFGVRLEDGAMQFGKMLVAPYAIGTFSKGVFSFQQRLGQFSFDLTKVSVDQSDFQHSLLAHEHGFKDLYHFESAPAWLGGDYLAFEYLVSGSHPDFRADPGYAEDAEGNICHLSILVNEAGRMIFGLPVAWIESAVFPIEVDPSYTVQPDSTAGLDNYIESNASGTNHGTVAFVAVGNETAGADNNFRTLITFDLTPVSTGVSITEFTVSLWLYANNALNNRAMKFYRVIRDWTEANSTWNLYKAGTPWSTAGAFDSNDIDTTSIGSTTINSGEALGEKTWELSGAASDYDEVEAMVGSSPSWTNNGFLIKADTEVDDQHNYRSSDYATAGERPKLVVVYASLAKGAPIFFG